MSLQILYPMHLKGMGFFTKEKKRQVDLLIYLYNSEKDNSPPLENNFHLRASEVTLKFNQEQRK